VRHLPNLITAVRLGLLPFFAIAAWRGERLEAIALVGVIAFSDVLDGWLARRFSLATPLGAFLDPLADKLCQVTGLVVLAAQDAATITRIPPWFVALVLGRDLLLGYGALRLKRSGREPEIRPRWSGKLSTLLVFAVIFAALVDVGRTAMLLAVALSAPVVVTAGVHYTIDGRRQARAQAPVSEPSSPTSFP